MRKKLLAVLSCVFLLVSVSLCACQKTESGSQGLENPGMEESESNLEGDGTLDDTLSEKEEISSAEESPIDEQEVVTMGVWRTSRLLDAYITAFNEGDYGYRIMPRVYYGEGTNKSEEDAMQRMLLELTSGSGPDLVLLDYVDEEPLAVQGYLEDLTPYFAESKVVGKEDFLESVIASYTYDEKLVALPRWIAVETLWGKSENLGETPGWTLEDMLSLVEKYPDTSLTCDINKEMFLNYCLLFADKEKLLDIDAGEDSSLGRILRKAASYPEKATYLQREEMCWQLHLGETLLMDMPVESLEQLLRIPDLVGGDALTPIGYPSSDGEPEAMLQVVNGLYAIPANAANKEGAWTFLEHFFAGDLDQRAEKQVTRTLGIPARKTELEEALQKELKKQEKAAETQESEPSFTEEQIRGWLEDLTGMVSAYHISDISFWDIVAEEAYVYFNGEKTLEETVQTIGNRGGIYMQERK